MSAVTDIFYNAWNKDAVNLKAAIDTEMSSRIAAQVQNMTADVAASMFVPNVEQEVTDQVVDQGISNEGTTDEDVQTTDQ